MCRITAFLVDAFPCHRSIVVRVHPHPVVWTRCSGAVVARKQLVSCCYLRLRHGKAESLSCEEPTSLLPLAAALPVPAGFCRPRNVLCLLFDGEPADRDVLRQAERLRGCRRRTDDWKMLGVRAADRKSARLPMADQRRSGCSSSERDGVCKICSDPKSATDTTKRAVKTIARRSKCVEPKP